MGFTLDFSDSEVRRVAADGGALRVDFAAAAVRRPGADGRPERGWLQGVALVLADARCTGDVATAFGRLAHGRLVAAGADTGPPAIPGTVSGDVDLALRFANGSTLSARGSGLRLLLADGARFSEDLSC